MRTCIGGLLPRVGDLRLDLFFSPSAATWSASHDQACSCPMSSQHIRLHSQSDYSDVVHSTGYDGQLPTQSGSWLLGKADIQRCKSPDGGKCSLLEFQWIGMLDFVVGEKIIENSVNVGYLFPNGLEEIVEGGRSVGTFPNNPALVVKDDKHNPFTPVKSVMVSVI